ERPVDRSAANVHPRTCGLHNCGGHYVRRYGDKRWYTEEQHQGRRHECAATHACEAHHHADGERDRGKSQIHGYPRTTPAPTVRLLASSIRMNEPVMRLSS